MRIKSLRLKDFKSYAGKHEIGPFDNFVAVVGSNASGKSNCFDAISFVLGSSASTMRCSSLSNLIWMGQPIAQKASVKLIFENRYGETQTIKRVVAKNGTAHYINGEQKTSKEYKNFLNRIGFDTKSNGFIIYQGDIHNIAAMKPIELTRLIEKISGSFDLKFDYEAKESEYSYAEKIVTQNEEYKDKMQVRKLALKDQAQEALRWKENNNELQKVEQQLELFDKCQMYLFLKNLASEIDLLSKEENQMNDEKINLQESLDSCFSAIDNIKERLRQTQSIHRKARRELERLKSDFKTDEVKFNAVKLNCNEKVKEINEMHNKIANDGTRLSYLKSKIDSYSSKNRSLIEHKAEVQTIYSDLTSNNNINDSSILNKEIIKSKLQNENDNQLRYQNQIDYNTKFIEDLSCKIKELECEAPKMTDDYYQIKESINHFSESLHENDEKLKVLKRNTYITKKHESQHRLLKTLQGNFHEVYGYVQTLYEPSTIKYKEALIVGLGKNLESIVVGSVNDAINCIEMCKNDRLGSATFIPLEKIIPESKYEKTKELVPLHQYIQVQDKRFKPLFIQLLKNTYYCENAKMANQLSKLGIYKKIVDIHGTVYRSDGLMTGGKVYNNDISKIGEINDLKDKISKSREELEYYETQKKEMENSFLEQEEKYIVIQNEKQNLKNQLSKSNENIQQLKLLKGKTYGSIHALQIQFDTYKIKEKELSDNQNAFIKKIDAALDKRNVALLSTFLINQIIIKNSLKEKLIN